MLVTCSSRDRVCPITLVKRKYYSKSPFRRLTVIMTSMDSLNISSRVVMDLVSENPKGIYLNDRVSFKITTPVNNHDELIVLHKSYISQHPWDEETRCKVSWLTMSIADILARSNKFGFDDSELQDLQNSEMRFYRTDGGGEEEDYIRNIWDGCRQYYGLDVKFYVNSIKYIYSWKYEGNTQAMYIYLLKIDINYVFVASYWVD